MSKRAIKLVKTARKNIAKRRRMSYVTPPQSPDNRSERQKILDLDIQRKLDVLEDWLIKIIIIILVQL